MTTSKFRILHYCETPQTDTALVNKLEKGGFEVVSDKLPKNREDLQRMVARCRDFCDVPTNHLARLLTANQRGPSLSSTTNLLVVFELPLWHSLEGAPVDKYEESTEKHSSVETAKLLYSKALNADFQVGYTIVFVVFNRDHYHELVKGLDDLAAVFYGPVLLKEAGQEILRELGRSYGRGVRASVRAISNQKIWQWGSIGAALVLSLCGGCMSGVGRELSTNWFSPKASDVLPEDAPNQTVNADSETQ